MADLAGNLSKVRERIAKAAEKAGRKADDVVLVAATKGVSVERLKEAVRLGLKVFGENRIQDALPKVEALAGSGAPSWHFIGTLQTNKAGKAVENFSLIQSLETLRLAEAISRRAEEAGKAQDVLCEVKLSPEVTKSGIPSEDVGEFLETLASLPGLKLRGLMTMAPYTPDTIAVRRVFRQARALMERHKAAFGPDPVLSMGMSDDFEIAIEEGSTMVRIGRALFGERPA